MSRGKRRCSQRRSPRAARSRAAARAAERRLLLGLIEHAQLEHRGRRAARAQVRQRPREQRRRGARRESTSRPPASSISRSSANSARSHRACPATRSMSSRHRQSSCGQPLEHPDPERGRPPRAARSRRAARSLAAAQTACSRWVLPAPAGPHSQVSVRAVRPAPRCATCATASALRAGRKLANTRAVGQPHAERNLAHARPRLQAGRRGTSHARARKVRR